MTSQEVGDVPVEYCTACSEFNITPAKFLSSPFSENRMHQLGSFSDVRTRTSCPLCRLICEAFTNGPVPRDSQNGVSLKIDNHTVQGCWNAVSSTKISSACLAIWIIPYDYDEKTMLTIRPLTTSISAKPYFARRVEGPMIDVQLAKSWLTKCETTHDCGKLKGTTDFYQTPPSFKVIDVINMCIVTPPERCRYLTLSYMWGDGLKFQTKKHNVQELSQPGGLQNHWDEISPTIKDAIIFTKNIGENYLWVDSLSIVQDEEWEAKSQAVLSMDLVYSQAILMISAAADISSQKGLLGVTAPRIPKQYTSRVGPDLVLAGDFNFLTYLNISKYNTRGWVFQEQQLAKRTLIFVNNQVYFSCLSHVYTEDVVAEDCSTDLILQSPVTYQRSLYVDEPLSIVYFQSVQKFTARQLSCEADILSAFDGISKVQDRSLHGSHFCGLPTPIFDIALLWQPIAATTRRPKFPSWSWAGWHGGVRWYGDTLELTSYGRGSKDLEYSMVTGWLRKHTWIDWYKSTSEGSVSTVWEPPSHRTLPTGKVSPDSDENEKAVGYNSLISSPANLYGRSREPAKDDPVITFQQAQQQPTASIRKPATRFVNQALDLSKQFLYFSTLSARYRITTGWSNSYIRYGSVDPVWAPHGRLIFDVLNRKNEVAGYVLLDESWRAKADIEYEFIMLSDANYFSNYGRPHDNHQYKKHYGMTEYVEYHAMMIVWKEGVAERAGLARILQESLKDACGEGPIWKDIVLG